MKNVEMSVEGNILTIKVSTSLKNLAKSLISNTPQQFSFLTSF